MPPVPLDAPKHLRRDKRTPVRVGVGVALGDMGVGVLATVSKAQPAEVRLASAALEIQAPVEVVEGLVAPWAAQGQHLLLDVPAVILGHVILEEPGQLGFFSANASLHLGQRGGLDRLFLEIKFSHTASQRVILIRASWMVDQEHNRMHPRRIVALLISRKYHLKFSDTSVVLNVVDGRKRDELRVIGA